MKSTKTKSKIKTPTVKKVSVKSIIPDDRNTNKGTPKGKEMIKQSFHQFGAGRSVLLDKNNRLIAGNKATENYIEGGGQNILIVETTGDMLVAVKRTDIDLDSAKGRELALADNQTQKIDYVPDLEVITELAVLHEIDVLKWGVEPKFDETVTAEGEENTSSLNLMYLVIDTKKIPMTDEERNELNALLKQYVDKNTTSIGFPKFLIDAAKDKIK
ncbi:MAG TPA: hypothetical protein VJY62_02505 [Bacteroidia bacterium]|nr:hypothetical protein [Bacteroidia bacterium]